MEEETEENMRLRFLAIEKRVAELTVNSCHKRDVYKLEAEINEIHSKQLASSFYLKEAQELLEESKTLYESSSRNFRFSLFLCGIILFLLFLQTW